MSTLAIDKMSWTEKLSTLEALWESLSREASRFESPAWHARALQETQQRYDQGAEEMIDWSDAKKILRQRIE